MFSNNFIQSIVDGVVRFSTDLLMPAMAIFFVLSITLRILIYYTVKREDWFFNEFSKRVRKFMDARDEKADQQAVARSARSGRNGGKDACAEHRA